MSYPPTETKRATPTTPADLALFAIGHGPVTVSMLAGTLLAHGTSPLDCVRVAREVLAALVLSGKCERVEVQGIDVYRIGNVPIAPSQSERV